jgi:hypothetical protein
MDKFERFFAENRVRLDTEDIDASLSERIAERISRHNRRKLVSTVYAIVSTAAIVVLIVMLFINRSGENQTDKTGLFSKIASDLLQEEASYVRTINYSVSEINKQKIPSECVPMFREFTQQLQIIDKQYEIYKAQVEKVGYSDEIIQQIMYNYQLKVSVLQTLKSEINKINNLKNPKSHESEKIQINL